MAPAARNKSGGGGCKAAGKASPGKKKKERTPSRNEKSKPAPTIRAYRFHEDFVFEAYVFEKNAGDDAFTNNFREQINGTAREKSEELEQANFNKFFYRRQPGSDNQHMIGEKGYWRIVMIRYPPEEEATPETTEEGLSILSEFFRDTRYSTYPPETILTMDCSTDEDPPALDQFFLDQDIKSLMEEDIDAEHLDSNFYTNFPDFARKCWAGTHYSAWARGIGFP